jgi:hypothetical protein
VAWNPDSVVVANDEVPDALVRRLVQKGLDVKGSHVLSRKSRHWASRNAPGFLAVKGDDEMYERLGALNVATYRKLGGTLYFLSELQRLCSRVYTHKAIQTGEDELEAMAQVIGKVADEEIRRQATFGAFVTSLVGSLDSLACEACLILGFDRSIWRMQFTDLLRETTKAGTICQPTDRDRFVMNLGKTIQDGYINATGDQADWFPQLLQYRHAATHRPYMLWKIDHRQLGPRKSTVKFHLFLNTTVRPGDVIPDCHSGGIRQSEADRISGEFQQCAVESYCQWVFDRCVSMMSDAYCVMADVFEQRANSPSLYINDPDVLLGVPSNLKRTRFQTAP